MRMHGHNYKVEIELENSTLDPDGFVLDYNFLKPFGKWIDDNLDHQHLNYKMLGQPSAENIAFMLFEKAQALFEDQPEDSIRISAVRVSETPKTWAEYRP